jgi:N-acetyl-anhydromuramyl-L-alanine amidase AmpD
MEINKLLTKVNYTKGNGKQNKYIVIHYVGATGGAEANCKYFYNTNRGASANYFVGHKGEVWQCVEDKDIAWHCGAKRYKHSSCRNTNSIGIELCCKYKNSNNTWYFEEETIKAATELTKELMKKYNIPAANVIRHYDVTGKNCPEPFVRDGAAWNTFKAGLSAAAADTLTTGYKVRITASSLNVRAGAGTGYKINTVVNKGEVYTIVGEFNGWGKLKSGAGWISLKYTERL